MKKLFIYFLLALFVATPAFAVGTVVVSKDETIHFDGQAAVRIVTIDCTGDASDGSIPDTTLSTTGVTGLEKPIRGWYLYRITVENATTETDVTDDSDIYLKDSGGADHLAAQGVDLLDADTYTLLRLENYDSMYDDPILSVENQSAVDATYTIRLIMDAGR